MSLFSDYGAATADIDSVLVRQREVSLIETSRIKGAAIKSLIQQNVNELQLKNDLIKWLSEQDAGTLQFDNEFKERSWYKSY